MKKKKLIHAIRGAMLTFVASPFLYSEKDSVYYESDALIIINDGKILSFGSFQSNKHLLTPDIEVIRYTDCIIMPGFIDTHVHYPQIGIIASYGKQLIDWLHQYTFVEEQKFIDREYAKNKAKFFIQQSINAGVTTMMTYGTVHPQSVDVFFKVADDLKMRVIAGKVLMDRNAPKNLLDRSLNTAQDETEELINKWHNKRRLSYAITPRFAITSSASQLELAGALYKKYPGLYMQTHLAENKDEIKLVKTLFPKAKNYLDVYDRFGLLGKRAVFAHGIHLMEGEWQRLYETDSSLAHCPTSNGFLGSGLFDFKKAQKKSRPIKCGLGSDLGAGTSFSPLHSMNEAYKIAALKGYSLSSFQAFYMATKGAAESLFLSDKIGSIKAGMEADLIVLDLKSTPLITERMKQCKNLEETLFVQMILGDERAIKAVYINGDLAHQKPVSISIS